ncbi:hypothetical protein WJ63_15840 [Burkholderia pyrrocinia]|nr:hypothetical protein WJ63_15840 [Burkholderia pyrrocinia]
MRALSLPRPAPDNALLRFTSRTPHLRRAAEAAAWTAAYGVAIGFLWYGALVVGPYLRSLG